MDTVPDYCYCVQKDSGSSVLAQFILPPLLGIIHYHRVVLIQERYSEMKSCMDFMPIWTCQQRLTITAASHGLVAVLYLKCKVLSHFTRQIIKWDFAFMLYWWRRVPKQSNVSNYWRFRNAVLGWILLLLLEINLNKHPPIVYSDWYWSGNQLTRDEVKTRV